MSNTNGFANEMFAVTPHAKVLIYHGLLVFCILNTLITVALQILSTMTVESPVSYGWKITLLIVSLALILLKVFHFNQIDIKGIEFLSKPNLVIAHRGGSIDAPENTLAAIKNAADQGVDGVEVDLNFTKDNVCVILHDSTVDRTTDGSGEIYDKTFDEIQSLDASSKHSQRCKYGSQLIPSLEEAVRLAISLNHIIFFDCKSHASQTASILAQLFERYPILYSRSVVCSFYPNILYMVRRSNSAIVTALIARRYMLSRVSTNGPHRISTWWLRKLVEVIDSFIDWSHISWLWYLCGNSLLLLDKDMLSREMVGYWKSLGVRVAAWTVNDDTEKLHLSSLECILITDKVNKD